MIRSRCEVLSVKRTGVYHSLTLVAPDIADRAPLAKAWRAFERAIQDRINEAAITA